MLPQSQPAPRKKVRVLYLGTGAPVDPSTGMDMVSRAHIDELLADRRLQVDGILVASNTAETTSANAMRGVTALIGDSSDGVSRVRRAIDRLLYAATRCGTLIAVSFRSAEARARIRRALASSDYDVVIVDHFLTLANLDLADLRASTAALMFIAHDIMSAQIADIGRTKAGRLKRLPFRVEAWKVERTERIVVGLARSVVFLSEFDRKHHPAVLAKSTSLLPLLDIPSTSVPGRRDDRSLVFVGSPAYLPNRLAIEWLTGAFAKALLRADPSMRIVLIGKGTEAYARRQPNVVGHGFLPDDGMVQAIDASIGVICPIVYGSGIKIKVLDALARSCPVFATAEALRGFERFEIEPVIVAADPAGSAERIVALAHDTAAMARERARFAGLWRDYRASRTGRLAQMVYEAGAPGAATPRKVDQPVAA